MASRECPRCRRLLLGGLAGLALLAVAAVAAGWGLGRWLMVTDPLRPARAIVVLAGDFPFRAMEAATLYREGWAREIWLQPSHAPARSAALARLGYQTGSEVDSNQAVLTRLGIPPEAFRLLSGRARNTSDEITLIAAEARREGAQAVIVVTSRPHTRRVRTTWRILAGSSPRLIVRFAREDPFDPGRWWRDPGDALAVSREVLGLLNAWAGFPVRPADDGAAGG